MLSIWRVPLGVEAVDTTRAEVFAAEALVGIGVSGYLSEGQGASADALLPDEPMLDALTGPVLLLMPGALRADVRALDVAAPLRHVGSYPLERAAPARAALRTPSAEGLVTGAPPPLDRKKADRKASGYVALAALVFLFVVVAMMVWIA